GIQKNSDLLYGIQNLLDKPSNYIPYTVIGEYALVGFVPEDIEHVINIYEKEEYIDVVSKYIEDPNYKLEKEEVKEEKETFNLPILGEVNAKESSLLLISVVIGFVDGFNPCAMWILLFIITMLIGMKDRKRMWILGSTFIFVSAFIYMIFMLAWLNIAMFATKISIIRLIIGLFALVFGLYNISKFVKKPESGCEVVDDKKRNNIIDRIKNITSNKKLIVSLLGISLLAVSVNVIELLCSAGLPFTYTNILAMNELSGLSYFIYILVYIFFFMLDDFIIFAIAMISFKVTGISTKYSRYSSLIGGIIMLLIGLLMIYKPELLMFNF
ncbi:MAG: hypothetical protein PHX40_02265, partial [Bacilli bacterium]|nr:hypothetical protein [Bacilli bacterium]